MKTIVEKIYRPDSTTRYKLPLFKSGVSAGFPSPAADYEEGKLDLNKHLVRNPAATFFVRVNGDSMIGAGIHSGDLLVVDRSLEPADKSVVIAVIDGELTVKRIRIRKGKVALEPENENYPARQIIESVEFEVWGVVTNVIHAL
jgi:DNA polymerase V